MCGICGIHSFDGLGAEDRVTLERMMRSLEHRGPDGDGLWLEGQAALGHRRLAIIDLEGGWQPLFNDARDVGVICNGEIYNYRELQRELEARGQRFRTKSDTEVIVRGYEVWGDSFVERLRGMFAIALWDAPRRRLLLVRDRFGVKPLYYAEGAGGRLLFASEIKALFADPSLTRTPNRAALAEYLAFRSVAGTETLFEGVHEVAPGAILILEDGRRTERRYWSPETGAEKDAHACLEDDARSESEVDGRAQGRRANGNGHGDAGSAVERGRELLADAVRSRLVSDVELGTITSGGLDSSLVSAIAAEAAGGAIDTFCVGFDDAAYDERPFARTVSAHIRSRHHEIVVAPEDLERELERLTWAHDEPLTHPNSVPMHLIFREAKERARVTVLLSGEGADEVFGGYNRYGALARRDSLLRLPGLSFVAAAAPAFGKLATLKKVMRPEYLLSANAFNEPSEVHALLRRDGAQTAATGVDEFLRRRRAFWPEGAGGADGMFVYDQRTYLPPLLQRQDRMSMAAGLEAREPFLDHHLAGWANRLGPSVKLPGGVRKGLLKEIALKWLPREIVHRRKVGFEMPLGAWLRAGGVLSGRVAALDDASSFVGEVVDPAAITRLRREHDSLQADHADLLWTLVALDAWARTFLGGQMRGERLPGAATARHIPNRGGV